jgi:hypothetical protein
VRGCTTGTSSLVVGSTSGVLDVSVIKLPTGPALALARRQSTEPFVRGPIPLRWIRRAGGLPGKALHVGLAIWFLVGLRKSYVVALSLSAVARDFGMDRATASRGLGKLARAGLVAVERHPGRKVTVRVVHAFGERSEPQPRCETDLARSS